MHMRKWRNKFGIPICRDLTNLQVSKERFKQIPYAFAKKHMVLPIREDATSVKIAVADPLNLTPVGRTSLSFEL